MAHLSLQQTLMQDQQVRRPVAKQKAEQQAVLIAELLTEQEAALMAESESVRVAELKPEEKQSVGT